MSPQITPLPFDSNLFGYPVGKCQVEDSFNESLFLDRSGDFELVYIFSKKPIHFSSNRILLADVKLTFEKKLQSENDDELEIEAYSGEMTDDLIALALESGVFSRFKTDPGFVKGEYEKLYRLWIKNALEQQEILVAGDFSGFVSCHTSETESSMGLIAVDSKQRGRGWGKRLVKAAENFAVNKGAQTLKIGTQEANTPAVNLYQSMGYQLVDRVYVYHWRKA